jgi:hypothetical protein
MAKNAGTGGGVTITGSTVSTSGGDIVGRDKTQYISRRQIDEILDPVGKAIEAITPEQKAAAAEKLRALKDEIGTDCAWQGLACNRHGGRRAPRLSTSAIEVVPIAGASAGVRLSVFGEHRSFLSRRFNRGWRQGRLPGALSKPLPIPRQEFVEPVSRVLGDAGQNVGQPSSQLQMRAVVQ